VAWKEWDWLLRGDAAGPSRADVAMWGRARRLGCNVLVGAVGVLTWLAVAFAGSAAVKPGVDFEEPFMMIVGPPIYALLANICYTIGPRL